MSCLKDHVTRNHRWLKKHESWGVRHPQRADEPYQDSTPCCICGTKYSGTEFYQVERHIDAPLGDQGGTQCRYDTSQHVMIHQAACNHRRDAQYVLLAGYGSSYADETFYMYTGPTNVTASGQPPHKGNVCDWCLHEMDGRHELVAFHYWPEELEEYLDQEDRREAAEAADPRLRIAREAEEAAASERFALCMRAYIQKHPELRDNDNDNDNWADVEVPVASGWGESVYSI